MNDYSIQQPVNVASLAAVSKVAYRESFAQVNSAAVFLVLAKKNSSWKRQRQQLASAPNATNLFITQVGQREQLKEGITQASSTPVLCRRRMVIIITIITIIIIIMR